MLLTEVWMDGRENSIPPSPKTRFCVYVGDGGGGGVSIDKPCHKLIFPATVQPL